VHDRVPAVVARSLASFLAAALLGACVQQASLPSDCGASSVQRPLTLSASGLDPSSTDVCRGQHVTLRIASQRDGEVHLHGYDDQSAEVEVQAGETGEIAFDATHVGQFILELHLPDGSADEVGVLTVHEP